MFRTVSDQRFDQNLFFGVRLLNLSDGGQEFLITVFQEINVADALHHIQSGKAALGILVAQQSADTGCQLCFRLFHQQIDGIDTHLAIFETEQFFYMLILFGGQGHFGQYFVCFIPYVCRTVAE